MVCNGTLAVDMNEHATDLITDAPLFFKILANVFNDAAKSQPIPLGWAAVMLIGVFMS